MCEGTRPTGEGKPGRELPSRLSVRSVSRFGVRAGASQRASTSDVRLLWQRMAPPGDSASCTNSPRSSRLSSAGSPLQSVLSVRAVIQPAIPGLDGVVVAGLPAAAAAAAAATAAVQPLGASSCGLQYLSERSCCRLGSTRNTTSRERPPMSPVRFKACTPRCFASSAISCGWVAVPQRQQAAADAPMNRHA